MKKKIVPLIVIFCLLLSSCSITINIDSDSKGKDVNKSEIKENKIKANKIGDILSVFDYDELEKIITFSEKNVYEDYVVYSNVKYEDISFSEIRCYNNYRQNIFDEISLWYYEDINKDFVNALCKMYVDRFSLIQEDDSERFKSFWAKEAGKDGNLKKLSSGSIYTGSIQQWNDHYTFDLCLFIK